MAGIDLRKITLGAALCAAAATSGVAAHAMDSSVVEPNVVRVLAFRGADQFVIGTAVAIGGRGLLLTTERIVRDAQRLIVLDGGLDIGRFGREARVRSAFADFDIAVIEADGFTRPGLPFAAARPRAGAKVSTVMFPGNVGSQAALTTPSTNGGTVAALITAPLRGAVPIALVEHDAAPKDMVHPGPLIDDCNRIVGFTVTGGLGQPGPARRYAVSAVELIRLLDSDRIPFARSSSPCPAPAATTAASQANPVLVREAQTLLGRLGFDAGTPDGIAGPLTRAAVGAFQERANLATDGQIDAALLAKLRAAVAAQSAPPPAIPPLITAPAAPSTPAPAATEPTLAVWTYAAAGAAAVLLAAALALLAIALRKRRAAAAASAPGRASQVLRAARAEREAPARWVLAGAVGNGRAVEFVVDAEVLAQAGSVVIGRSSGAAGLMLEDPSVSRAHARLSLDHGALVLEDLQSTNGTRVDGVQVAAFRPTPVCEGSLVAFGDVQMKLARA